MISIDVKSSVDLSRELAQRVRARRKEQGLTQEQLAIKAGMTLPSYKRFEQKGLISFQSLAAIAIALGYESDIEALFSQRSYKSIDDVLRAKEKARRIQ